jgi:hypothetical protein
MNLSQSLGNLSHHAYGIISDVSVRLDIISFLEREHGIVARGNPDLFVQKYEVFTIPDARGLKTAHSTRPFSSKNDKDGKGGRKFFIIEVDSITHEAQNALLKIFEEPNEYAHFFLIIPSEELLLPTLRSRLFMVRNTRSDLGQDGIQKSDFRKDIADFLASTPAERMAIVDKLAADISDGKKSKSVAIEFCGNLSRYLRKDGIDKNLKGLVAISQAESFLRDRAPSVKQLLEYVVLRMQR